MLYRLYIVSCLWILAPVLQLQLSILQLIVLYCNPVAGIQGEVTVGVYVITAESSYVGLMEW
jgi:hypothetical protein